MTTAPNICSNDTDSVNDRASEVPVPFDRELEREVFGALPFEPATRALLHAVSDCFYYLPTRFIAAFKKLAADGRLRVEYESRIGGCAVPWETAMGHPNANYTATIPGLRNALIECGSPIPDADVARIEEMLAHGYYRVGDAETLRNYAIGRRVMERASALHVVSSRLDVAEMRAINSTITSLLLRLWA